MRQKLLLHVCCAPCSIAVIDEIKDAFDVTVFFYNPNIHPSEEYAKRKKEVIRVCGEWGVAMVDADYEPESWESRVGQIAQKRENGPRCAACTMMRLRQTGEYARAHGFDRFATSLTSSRRKKAEVVNAQGAAVAQEVGVPFLAEDWKKGGRTERGLIMLKERGIYRQRYCGCRFSLAEMLEREARKTAVITRSR